MWSLEKLRELLGMNMIQRKGLGKMQFELKNEGSNSFEEESSESDDEVEL